MGRMEEKPSGHFFRSAAKPAVNDPNCACVGGVRTHIAQGRDAAIATIMQGEPCRIMAYFPGRALPTMAAHVVDTSWRRCR